MVALRWALIAEGKLGIQGEAQGVGVALGGEHPEVGSHFLPLCSHQVSLSLPKPTTMP